MFEVQEVRDFIIESNAIEGIKRPYTDDEINATAAFLTLPRLTIDDVAGAVSVYQPGAKLRDKPGMGVRVGAHIAPPGGPGILSGLGELLADIEENAFHPFVLHRQYEILHPFTDGNGRSGRLLWAWQMLHHDYWPGLRLGFLHAWYYQSLEHLS